MIFNGFEHISKEQRKRILLLSDDLRLNSGVGTVSRQFVLGTAHRFNWFQLGAAMNHPEIGKRIDVSADINQQINIIDSEVIVQPSNGYGNPDLIRALLREFKFDAILHFTDPRQWIWLYQMEHELRQEIPIFYYHVWDNLPYPMYNKPYYESCDWIGCISKQTKNLVENVWSSKEVDPENGYEPWQITYIGHGINPDEYYPISEENPGKQVEDESKNLVSDYDMLLNVKKQLFRDKEYDFVVFYNNRNIRRKNMGSTILGFKTFCDMLDKNKSAKCALIMKTQVVDANGTDLFEVKRNVCPDYDVYFHDQRVPPTYLNYLYNIADVTVNIASAEGFGLATAESLMAGTPIIANVTGGLQDQMGFVDDAGSPIEFHKHWGTNSNKAHTKHGDWAFPIFPSARNLVGSPPTPYIFDDHLDHQSLTDKLYEVYQLSPKIRKQYGQLGREFMLSETSGLNVEEMSKRFIVDMENIWEKWVPRQRFSLIKT